MDGRDEDSVRRLYEQTGRAAILKTARLVGRIDVAEEIVQTAFLKLWDSGVSFPNERAAYAWIYRTCHNAGIDHLRAHAHRFERSIEPGDERFASAEFNAAELIEQREWVKERLLLLTEREAQILAYRIMDGMTQDEIAEVLGVSRKTVVRDLAAIEEKLGV